LFNEKIFIKKHPINFHFVTGRYNRFKADAIYDIKLDKWVKKPESIEEDDIENLIESCQSVKEFNEILEEYINLKKLLESYTGDQEQLEEIFKQTFKVNNLFEKIRDIRREEFKKRKDPKLPSANFRCSNIIYKLLERYGLEDLAQELTKFVQRGF
jgi:predicted nuclease with TOPRIM domain